MPTGDATRQGPVGISWGTIVGILAGVGIVALGLVLARSGWRPDGFGVTAAVALVVVGMTVVGGAGYDQLRMHQRSRRLLFGVLVVLLIGIAIFPADEPDNPTLRYQILLTALCAVFVAMPLLTTIVRGRVPRDRGSYQKH